MMCPWSGLNCQCQTFPWKVNRLIPERCERLMMEQSPYTAAVRDVSPAAKDALKAIVAADLERMRNPNKVTES